MKIQSAKTYSYSFYHAMVIDQNVKISAANRICVLSTKPLTVTTSLFQERLDEKNYAGNGMIVQMIKGAKCDHLITLEHPDKDGVLYIVSAEGDKIRTEHFDSPMRILSQHDEWTEVPEWTPLMIIQSMGIKEKLESEPIETDTLLAESIEKAKTMAVSDRKFGLEVKDEVVDELVKAGEQLREMVTSMPDVTVGANGPEPLDGDKARYATVKATDFTKVAIFDNDGTPHAIDWMRVAHLSAPTWHSEPKDYMKAHGYIGYWEFPEAALGERQADTGDGVQVAFMGFKGLRVAVHKIDSINPAGEVPIPLDVYRALSDKEPDSTMSAEEAVKFGKANMPRSYDEPATTEAN